MDEPMNKRTEQNRMAQRAFRERQKSAQDSLTQQRDHFNEMCVRLQGENDKLFADFQRLETENQTLSAHCDKVDSSLKVLEEESELNRARADQGLHVLSHWQDKVREANLTLHKVTQEMKRKDEELLQRDSMIQQLMARNSEMESELQQYRVQISSQRSSASTAASLTGKFQNLQTTNPNQSGSSFNLLPENPSLSGCGDCGENGDCPCVDNFVSADSTAPGSMGPPLQRSSSSTSMAIGSLLSPSSRPAALPTQGFFQQGASFTQLETDLTFAFKQPEKQLTVDSVMSDLSPNTCGACGPDDKLCLCRNAHNDTGAASSSQSPTAFQTSGAAAMQPGSCDKCQTDPRQRAYCISLAEQATLNSASKRPESFNAQNPDPKRRRISEHMVSCSEAYNITERLSVASTVQSGASEDAFLDAIGEMKEIIGNDGQPRKYSAFEVNIGTVLTSLRGGSSRGLEGELGADHLGI
jgi:hypothetical protein